jgi:hypothetical protein
MPVKAKEELVIKDLQINNGVITPEFDKYNNYYSVTIDENVTSLEFNYDYDNNSYEVKVTNNEDLVDNKLVYVSIYDKDTLEYNTYIFKIYVEEVTSTINIEEEKTDTVESDDTNYAPLIGAVCFILIIFVYYLLFLR